MATLDELHQALINADAAGDHEAAQALADHIRGMQTAPVSPSLQVNSPAAQWSNIGAESLQQAGIKPALTDRDRNVARLMASIPFNLGDEFMARAASDPMLHQYTKDAQPYDAALAKARGIQGQYADSNPIENAALGIPGNIAGTMALPGGPVAQGTVGGALQGFGSGEGENDRINKGVVGGVTGLASSALLSGVGKLMSQPKVSPDVKTLMDANIPLTPGQIAGGTAKKAEDIATSIPIVGDFIAKRQNESIEALGQAVANRSLGEINQTLPANVTPGRSTVAYVRKAMTDSYNNVLGAMSAAPDAPFSAQLQTAKAIGANLPEAQAKDFDSIIQSEIFDKIAKSKGVLTGDDIKGIESTLTDNIKGYGKGSWNEQKLSDALGNVKQAFRDMIQRQNPTLAPQLAATDRAYANYAILRKAGSAVGNDGGVFSPSQLQGAVASADASAGKGNFASGTARMQDLSDAAKNVLPSKFQDSGTARRLMQLQVLGLGGSGGGAAAYLTGTSLPAAIGAGTALGVGTAAYTTPGQAFLRALMTANRPGGVAAAGQGLKLSAPALSAILPALLRASGQ